MDNFHWKFHSKSHETCRDTFLARGKHLLRQFEVAEFN